MYVLPLRAGLFDKLTYYSKLMFSIIWHFDFTLYHGLFSVLSPVKFNSFAIDCWMFVLNVIKLGSHYHDINHNIVQVNYVGYVIDLLMNFYISWVTQLFILIQVLTCVHKRRCSLIFDWFILDLLCSNVFF